jgi:pyruvate dehydrogenase E2 component (dihydrolipoyllysine-residue acetyltransferase)
VTDTITLMSDSASAAARAAPGARQLADVHDIDLTRVAGSGPGGRILRSDVEALVAAAEARGPGGVADELRGSVRRTELTRIQRIVVRRIAQSKNEVPTFTLESEVDMGACLALRADLRANLGQQAHLASLNDIVVKACAVALREHPTANGAYVDGVIERYDRVNVGIAVSAPGVLVVPTIFDADTKSLDEIAADTRNVAGRVRDGTLAPADLVGGTFTVSNLGMMNVRRFTAIINPPQAAILAVGSVVERQRNGRPSKVMSVTLTCDHRVLYGADAADLLELLRYSLQSPAKLV